MLANDISFRIDEPVVLVGAVALVLWALSERLLQLLRLRQPKAEKRERLSWYGFTLAYYGAFIFPLLDAATYHWSTVGPDLAPARWVGVPLVVAGIGIRILARLTLGKQFSGHVQTSQGHRLITTGIYRSIRHPAYLGYLCLLLGFPICFGSVAGFAWAIVTGIPALLYRIRIEEAALERWFPGEYGNIRQQRTDSSRACGERKRPQQNHGRERGPARWTEPLERAGAARRSGVAAD